MIIIGVDPGLIRTGYGVLSSEDNTLFVLGAGVIKGLDATEPLEKRVHIIHEGIARILEQIAPQEMAMEEVYSHYEHPQTAILMGHARGVICLAAAQRSIPVYNYSAARVKTSVTGSGRASKEQVQRMIQMRLSLPEVPSPNDIADALALALCHYEMQERRRRSLIGDISKEARGRNK